jgi:AcrR family transcriptional regulator
VRHGYENTTTARIAERAGVSIGSLHQYFPNKEAIVAALIVRHADKVVVVMRDALARNDVETLEDGLQAIIQAGMDAHRIDPALHKVLTEQVPRVGQLAKAINTSRQITEALEKFLRQHRAELRPERDPQLAALVVETVVEALGHKAVIERPELLATGVIQNEAFDLVYRYVCSAAGSGQPLHGRKTAHGLYP